tara:strand:- start:184 stop:642 length:459 start_codon:yes stop_codon:yes gene_type:complete
MYTKKNGRVTFKSNRRPNYKRNNNYGSKGRNKGNITQQYNKYLKLAKDTFSSGDRIQSEYYFQFTDHYYRMMIELGITLEDQESSQEKKLNYIENNDLDENKESTGIDKEKIEEEENQDKDEDKDKDKDEEQSIESVQFISEPVKKKVRKSK